MSSSAATPTGRPTTRRPASSPRPPSRRRRPPSAPRLCRRTRRRSSCCIGRCAAWVTTGSACPTCWPGGRRGRCQRPQPPGGGGLREGAGPAPRARGSGRRRPFCPTLVAARHLLGDPLPARIALLDEGLARGWRDGELRGVLMAAKAAAYLVDDRLDDAIEAGEEALATAGQDEQTRLDTAATLGSVLVFAGRMDEGWSGSSGRPARGRARARGRGGPRVPADRLVRVDSDRVRAGRAMAQQGHRVRRPHRAVEPPALHGRPPAHVWWCRGRWVDADRSARSTP